MKIIIVVLILVILRLLIHIRQVTSDKDTYKSLYDMWLNAHLEEWKENNILKEKLKQMTNE
jgi:hypothetical protein